jgi:deazaflavin-dependent oxidoreductase (nitroreductase family)
VTDEVPGPNRAALRPRRWFPAAARAPMVAYRLGLAPLVGRRFMLLTTTGRRSGRARHNMVMFHSVDGRPCAAALYGPRSDWYRNLAADPRATVQTARGTASMRARLEPRGRGTRAEIAAWPRRGHLRRHGRGAGPTDDDRVPLVCFEPTDEPTPPGVKADLVWVWGVVLGAVAVAVRRRARA